MNLVSTDCDYYIELLEQLTRRARCTPTNVVVCLPRPDFLRHVALQVQRQSEPAVIEDTTEPQSGVQHDVHDPAPSAHSFMVPTLRLIAASRAINLIYCPTIPVLRAWLSGHGTEPASLAADRPQVVILDLLALHHGTSEFTVQGLSRTLATAVSAAQSSGSDLTLAECKDIEDPSNPDRGRRLWDAQLPLLSGSVKIGLERSRWAGQPITARRVASRWFRFTGSHDRQ